MIGQEDESTSHMPNPPLMDADAVDRVLRKHAKAIGIARGYSAHGMPATSITTALDNGYPLEDVQPAVGHVEPSTTKLHDRSGYNPEKSESSSRLTSIFERSLVFRTGEKADFERMLDDIFGKAKLQAERKAIQVEHEAAARGSLISSGTVIAMEERLTPIHESALADAVRLIVQFSERTGISVPELNEVAKPKLESLTEEITARIARAAGRMNLAQVLNPSRDRFDRRVENALRDVEIGFIQGRSAIVTETTSTQRQALRVLEALYHATRGKEEPVFLEDLRTGLSEEDARTAWGYLKDRHLIQTYSMPYAARINAVGIDAIEAAQRRPDQASSAFPSVSYNIVHNTMNVGTMSNSPIQQGGIDSVQNQTVSYSAQDLEDLGRLVSEFTAHIDELGMDAPQKKKAEAQIATIKAQLMDEPDPVVVRQAGRTLRNVTEGAIGSLLATAAQPTVWAWAHEVLRRLFG